MKIIRSRDNPLLKKLIKMSGSSRERRLGGYTVLDGDHLIEAYREAGLGEIELLAASESGMARESIATLMNDVPAKDRALFEDRLFNQISQVVTPGGILALINTPAPRPLPENIFDAIYLEALQDPGNLGSILRTALASGVRCVLLSPDCVFAWAPKVIRAGMGAHFHLDIYEKVSLSDLRARASGNIISTEVRDAASIYDVDLSVPAIWLFGNEGAGLSDAAGESASMRATIPIVRDMESLNVAASVAICLFEQRRQRLVRFGNSESA